MCVLFRSISGDLLFTQNFHATIDVERFRCRHHFLFAGEVNTFPYEKRRLSQRHTEYVSARVVVLNDTTMSLYFGVLPVLLTIGGLRITSASEVHVNRSHHH